MKTKTILTFLLLASFFSLGAQDAASDDTSHRPLVFESVSFSAVQGSIIIACKDAGKLTNFEFTGKEEHLAFEWNSAHPADLFPMKISAKPGKVTIKYKMCGEKSKTIQLKLVAHREVKLTLKSQSPCLPTT